MRNFSFATALTPSLRLSINTECARARRFTPQPATRPASPPSSAAKEPMTLALIYYANPTLLLRHLEVIRTYPKELKALIHLLIIDDGSPNHLDAATYLPSASLLQQHSLASLNVVRISIDLPWNIGGARNLAFHLAATSRVLLLDIDTPAPPEVMKRVVKLPSHDGTTRQQAAASWLQQ